TLFRILATLLAPHQPENAGHARIFDHDVQREPAAVRRMLGVVFQQPSLDAKLTARENLVHQGRLYGLTGRDLHARIDQWLERFDLADRADEYTERFSGGMRRRVELAKAMLHEPRLLLMDEPATGLDPGARHELWQQLQRLREQQHITVALTTHLMDEADRCDRLAIISRGRLVALDTPTQLKAAVGGDVVTVELAPSAAPDAPQRLAERITERLGPWDERSRPQVIDGKVRFEKPDGTALVTQLTHLWPDNLHRISVGQPTLEDVFLDLTGAAFRDQER
ncbi:MAG: ATP-binding cassette domain-containing protein, partial [Phycisphaeraceae bacterium]